MLLAAADVRVQNRDSITRNDDVEESRKDLIVRSHPQCREERGLRQNKSGVSQVANARVQSRSDIAEGFGRHPEDSILCASPHIYEIMGCDRTNKDSQEEEKLGGGKSLVTQAAIDEMLRRGAAYTQM